MIVVCFCWLCPEYLLSIVWCVCYAHGDAAMSRVWKFQEKRCDQARQKWLDVAAMDAKDEWDEILLARPTKLPCGGQNIHKMHAGLARAVRAIQIGASEETIIETRSFCVPVYLHHDIVSY